MSDTDTDTNLKIKIPGKTEETGTGSPGYNPTSPGYNPTSPEYNPNFFQPFFINKEPTTASLVR